MHVTSKVSDFYAFLYENIILWILSNIKKKKHVFALLYYNLAIL